MHSSDRDVFSSGDQRNRAGDVRLAGVGLEHEAGGLAKFKTGVKRDYATGGLKTGVAPRPLQFHCHPSHLSAAGQKPRRSRQPTPTSRRTQLEHHHLRSPAQGLFPADPAAIGCIFLLFMITSKVIGDDGFQQVVARRWSRHVLSLGNKRLFGIGLEHETGGAVRV